MKTRLKLPVLLHLFALMSTLVFLTLQTFDPVFIREYVEGLTYDLRLKVKTMVVSAPQPDDIVIVTVDERSIAEIGRWPWPRSTMAKLVERVSSGNPKVIGMDILFSESERKQSDSSLGRAVRKAGNVALAAGFIVNPEKGLEQYIPKAPDYLWDYAFLEVKSTKDIPWKNWVVNAEGVLAPINDIGEGVAAVGSVYTQSDMDGKLRWDILYVHHEDNFYPSLSLQMARIYMGLKPEDLKLIAGRGVMLGDKMINTDLSGRVLINYLGPELTFKYIPASDILNGRVDASVLKGKAVFIGTSAVATYDQKVTPLSSNYPGVEKNATVLYGILHNDFNRPSPGVLEIVIIILTAVILTSLLYRLKALHESLLFSALFSLYVLLCFYVLIYNKTWVTLIYPSMNMLAIFLVQSTTKFFVTERKAKEIRRMFTSYVSPRVVEALINNPEMAKLGGQRKEVTVLFSDIAGFTSMSEKMAPEEVVHLLNEYFKAMTDVIFRWEGTFDKIVGDEIMAFWGAPVDQQNHPELAVRCALDMFNKLGKLHEKWGAEGKPLMKIGVGINTGHVLVGNIGAEDKKMDYTIIGDHVNAGARVEALTRKFEAKILMTQFTAEHIRPIIESKRMGHVRLDYKDTVKVKGKELDLEIYELVDLKGKEGEDHDDEHEPKEAAGHEGERVGYE